MSAEADPENVSTTVTLSTARTDTIAEFRAGYSLGYGTGYEVGYRHGVDDEAAAWQSVMTGITAEWRRHPRHDEIMAARELSNDPCATRCRRCSSCTRAAAVRRNRDRFSGDDYPGTEALAGAA